MASGQELFREQMAGEYNRLTGILRTNPRYVIARSRLILRQADRWLQQSDLTEAERLWLEVIKESFEELIERAGGTP